MKTIRPFELRTASQAYDALGGGTGSSTLGVRGSVWAAQSSSAGPGGSTSYFRRRSRTSRSSSFFWASMAFMFLNCGASLTLPSATLLAASSSCRSPAQAYGGYQPFRTIFDHGFCSWGVKILVLSCLQLSELAKRLH